MKPADRDLQRLPEAMAILDELLDAGPDECRLRLQRLRATDIELAGLVKRLLAADRDDDDRLEQPPPVPRLDEPPERMIGRQLGAWRLVELIGQGGMGVVYRAERADGQFQQECALKLIAVGLGQVQARQRFLRERQILASLQHDNIAALIDGGVSEQGEPWYAMERVDGTPLDRWCDQQRLDVRERVIVFRRVLDAVRYAHSRFVVHRDLKPSNILVTADGRVKLLDFGVAKLIENRPGAAATVDFAMTPEYAAPEQIYGEAVGPAADIYSLGVLLYQLLAGASPYGGDVGGAVLLRQRLGRVRDEAEPLSQVAGRQPPDIALLRRMRPSALRRSLRGALSAIVHTCLQHDPGRRYLNVDALDDDLVRWLEHRPVQAYRGHWRYRAGQFLRRNRAGLSVLVVVVVAIAAFTAYRSVQLAQVRYERDLYTQTFNFVTDVIARATSGPAQDELTVREVLDLMQAELGRRDLPADVRVWLMGMISDVHAGARDLNSALAAAERGIEAADGVDPLVQARLHEGQAMAQEIAGRHREALASIDEALDLVERARPDRYQVAALSRLLTTKVRYGHRQRLVTMAQAQPLLQRAIELGDPGRRGPVTSAQERAQAQLALIDAHLLERDYASAATELARARKELDAAGLLGNDLLLDTRIAVQRLVLGETASALAALEALLAQWITRYGPDFRNVASVQAQYAEALERSGRIAESVQASEQARRIARRGGNTNMDVLDQDRLLARRLLRAGNISRAEQLAVELVQLLVEREEPIARATLIQAWLLRAEAAVLLGDETGAVAALAHADQVLAEFDPEAPGFLRAQRSWQRLQAERCLLREDLECAERHARAVLDAAKSVLDDPHELLLARRTLVLALRARAGGEAEAERLIERYHSEAVELFDVCNPLVRILLDNRPLAGMQALIDAARTPCG